MVTFEQRPRDEEASLVNTWRENFLGRETSKCKGPEVDVCLACLKERKEAHVAGTEQARRLEVEIELEGQQIKEGSGSQSWLHIGLI